MHPTAPEAAKMSFNHIPHWPTLTHARRVYSAMACSILYRYRPWCEIEIALYLTTHLRCTPSNVSARM